MYSLQNVEGGKSLLEQAKKIAILYDDADQVASSLSKYTKPTRINPPLTVTKGVTQLEAKSQTALVQTCVSLYSMFYREAFQLMTLRVNNISVLNILDALSTNRSIRTAFGAEIGAEAISTPVLTKTVYQRDIELMTQIKNSSEFSLLESNKIDPNVHIGLEAVSNDELTNWSNLAVGKTLVFKIQPNNNTAEDDDDGKGKKRSASSRATELAVTIRAIPQVVDADVLTTALENVAVDNSFMGRLHRTRAGELSVWEFLTLRDLIKQDRKSKIKDVYGIISNARERQRNGVAAAVVTGRRSVNTVSGIMVITSDERDAIEKSARGKFRNFKDRQQIMKLFGAMIIVVVNPRNEDVDIYLDDISEPGRYQLEDLVDKSKSANGIDMDDMIKAYNMGSVGL